MIHLKISVPFNYDYLAELFYPSRLVLPSAILTPIPAQTLVERGFQIIVFCKSQTLQVLGSPSRVEPGCPVHYAAVAARAFASTWARERWCWTQFSLRMCVSSLLQSDNHYNENVPSIKIPMDMMEQEPFLGDKASDSE